MGVGEPSARNFTGEVVLNVSRLAEGSLKADWACFIFRFCWFCCFPCYGKLVELECCQSAYWIYIYLYGQFSSWAITFWHLPPYTTEINQLILAQVTVRVSRKDNMLVQNRNVFIILCNSSHNRLVSLSCVRWQM